MSGSLFKKFHYLRSKKEFQRSPLRTIFKLVAWRAHCLLSREATITLVKGSSLKMILPPEWHGQAKLYYAFGWQQDDDLVYLVEKAAAGSIIFDVGANTGAWTLLLSNKVGPGGSVIACEPSGPTYQALAKNVALNRLTNAKIIQVALSDVPGTVRLYHDIDATRNSLGRTRTDDANDFETVCAATLDAVVSELQLGRVDILKIDAEGAEPLVLRGAMKTIEAFRPTILFEINATAMKAVGVPHDAAWRILSQLGYSFYSLETGALIAQTSCPRGGNIWAIHHDEQGDHKHKSSLSSAN